jgi:general secretion pathway protein L
LLGEFFDWWGRQLLDLVPAGWRGGGQGADALIADARLPGLLTLLRRRRGVEARLGQMRLDDTAAAALRAALSGRPRGETVFLRLPAEAVLERSVILPLAAERDPERVLGYEMERLTPFTVDEVFWGFGIEARDKARGRLVLRLTVVPRAAIAGLIEVLARHGGRPDLLEAALPGGMRSIRLTHEGGGGARSWLSERGLAAAVAVLLVLVIASPFLRQSLQLSDLQDRLETMRPQMVQAEKLRRQISGAGTGGDAVAAETRRLGDTLEALAAVTEILPDDSYLTEFTMRERKMTLSGLSASAPKLINALSTDPRIRNPSFTAPVTRSESNHNDVFSIRAELANQ